MVDDDNGMVEDEVVNTDHQLMEANDDDVPMPNRVDDPVPIGLDGQIVAMLED